MSYGVLNMKSRPKSRPVKKGLTSKNWPSKHAFFISLRHAAGSAEWRRYNFYIVISDI